MKDLRQLLVAALVFEAHTKAIAERVDDDIIDHVAKAATKAAFYLKEMVTKFTDSDEAFFAELISSKEEDDSAIIDIVAEAKDLSDDIVAHIDSLPSLNKWYGVHGNLAYGSAIEAKLWLEEYFGSLNAKNTVLESEATTQALEEELPALPEPVEFVQTPIHNEPVSETTEPAPVEEPTTDPVQTEETPVESPITESVEAPATEEHPVEETAEAPQEEVAAPVKPKAKASAKANKV